MPGPETASMGIKVIDGALVDMTGIIRNPGKDGPWLMPYLVINCGTCTGHQN